MIDLGVHAEFIVWAYIGVALTVLALIVSVIASRRQVERKIARLEAASPRRRSAEKR